MFAKIRKGNGFGGCLDYITRVKQDDKPIEKRVWKILDSDGVRSADGEKDWRKRAAADIERPTLTRSKIKDPCGHIALGFAPEDAHRLTDEFMTQVAKEYMEAMGIKNTPYVIVRHTDADHPHCHLMFSRVDYEIYQCLWRWAKRRHKKKGRKWIAKRYWHHIGDRQWTFSALTKNTDGDSYYTKLEYATDTPIIRFKKIVAEANPFDENWTEYFEEREGEKMLHNTKGREKLLTIWRRQNRRCPVCGEPITSETGFKVHTPPGKGAKKIMVHAECHKKVHSLNADFEPGLRQGGF